MKEWVPTGWKHAHYDPEFLTYTWGDYSNIRTYWARKLQPGDYYFFISSLRHHRGKGASWDNAEPNWSYCLIGLFEIAKRPKQISYPVAKTVQQRYGNNAHVRRKPDPDGFLLFTGTEKSKLLKRAIPISRGRFPNKLATIAIPSARASYPRWWQELLSGEGVRLLLKTIHSQ